MNRLLSKLSCRGKPSVMDDTCFQEDSENSEDAAIRYALLNPPLELMFPALCNYILDHKVAATLDLDALIHALRTNDTLVRLHVHGDFLVGLSLMEQHLFWQVVCQVPTLRILGLLDFNGPVFLKTSLLKTILEGREKYGQTGLQEIEMSHVLLEGDMKELSKTLQAHNDLRLMTVWDVDHVDSSQNDVLQMLVDVRQLKSLFLGRFRLDETQIALVAKAVSHPEHKLQILRLIGRCKYTAYPLTYPSCQALANMLKVNQSLLDLELTNLQLVDNSSGLTTMIRALQQHNRTLKSFQMFQMNLFSRHDLTPEENDALVDLVQDNPVLERCLPNGTGRAHDLVEFHLKLNRCRLRGIHADVNLQRANVIRILEALKGDLDCFYHILRDNPSMMQV